MINYEAGVGEHIDNVLQVMIDLANKHDEQVTCDFNDTTITANKGDIVEHLICNWHIEQKRLHKEYLASPKGIESERKHKENEVKCQKSIARGNAKFEIIDQASWDKGLANNQDDYGQAIYRYASRWAAKMEEGMNEGKKLEDIAGPTSFEVDEEGITGFMQGAAVSVLSHVWKHGKELKKCQ